MAAVFQIDDDEQRARELLVAIGVTWIKNYRNQKKWWKNAAPTSSPPEHDATVLLPPDVIVLDVDDDVGLECFEHFVSEQPATLVFVSRRGPKAVYRLPDGYRPKAAKAIWPGVELLTRAVVAPGSTVEGVYYRVRDLNPVATLDEATAQAIVDQVGSRDDDQDDAPTGIELVVEHWNRYTPDARRKAARAERGARQPGRRPSGSLDEAWTRAAELTSDSTKGLRHPALLGATTLLLRYEVSVDEIYRFLLDQPAGAKLHDKKHEARRWFTTVILPKAEALAQTPLTSREQWKDLTSLAAQRAYYGQPARAHHWARKGFDIIDASNHTQHRKIQLSAIVQLHASWIACFGPNWGVSSRTEAVVVGIAGRNGIAKLRTMFSELGIARKLPSAKGSMAATRWDWLVDGVRVQDLPDHAVVREPEAIHLFDDEEITSILKEVQAINERETEVKERKAQSWEPPSTS